MLTKYSIYHQTMKRGWERYMAKRIVVCSLKSKKKPARDNHVSFLPYSNNNWKEPSLRMAGAPSSFSTQLCTTCSSCALAQVGTFHFAQVVILHFAFCILYFVFCSGWRVPSFGKHQFVDHYSHHNQCPHDDQQSSSNCKLFPRHPRDPWPGEYMRKCMEVYFQHVWCIVFRDYSDLRQLFCLFVLKFVSNPSQTIETWMMWLWMMKIKMALSVRLSAKKKVHLVYLP